MKLTVHSPVFLNMLSQVIILFSLLNYYKQSLCNLLNETILFRNVGKAVFTHQTDLLINRDFFFFAMIQFSTFFKPHGECTYNSNSWAEISDNLSVEKQGPFLTKSLFKDTKTPKESPMITSAPNIATALV